MKYLTLAFGLVLIAPVLQAAPQPFQAVYTVTAKGITLGDMTANLTYSPNGYTYQKITKANGVAALLSGDTLTEISTGHKQGQQLLPQHYLHQHKSKRKNKQDEFQFVTPSRVEGQYDGNTYQFDVPKGSVDPALMELLVMDDLANNKGLKYEVVSKGKLHPYQLQKVGKETLEVPAGKFDCEKVEIMHDDPDQHTTLWLAPALNYGIVQVRHQENSDVIESRLTRYQNR